MQGNGSHFGFISYYINSRMHRIPVEFFSTDMGLMAWLDGGKINERLWTSVIPEMNSKEIGDFATVMVLYKEESIALFQNHQLWQQCIQRKSGLLLLFRAMHEMRTRGYAAQEAVEVAIRSALELKESESNALQEIATMYTASDCLAHPERYLPVKAVETPIGKGIVSVT